MSSILESRLSALCKSQQGAGQKTEAEAQRAAGQAGKPGCAGGGIIPGIGRTFQISPWARRPLNKHTHRKQHQGAGGGSGGERPPRAGHIWWYAHQGGPNLVLNQSGFQVEPK